MSGNYWIQQDNREASLRAIGRDTMQVCKNGHQITSSLRANPGEGKKHCPDCGAATISACEACGRPIRGFDWGGGVFSPPSVPNFCEECGAPFPWVQTRLATAVEIIGDLDGLDGDERQKLAQAVRDLTADTPRTGLAIDRFKKLAKKGGAVLGSTLYKIAIDVATDAAKKSLSGG